MKNFKITLTITAENEEQATQIASKLQSAAKKVDGNTLAKMLVKLEKNPQWISLATKFCSRISSSGPGLGIRASMCRKKNKPSVWVAYFWQSQHGRGA